MSLWLAPLKTDATTKSSCPASGTGFSGPLVTNFNWAITRVLSLKWPHFLEHNKPNNLRNVSATLSSRASPIQISVSASPVNLTPHPFRPTHKATTPTPCRPALTAHATRHQRPPAGAQRQRLRRRPPSPRRLCQSAIVGCYIRENEVWSH